MKLTWLGEDELHGPDQAGPSFTRWNGIKFEKNVPVSVDNPDMIRRAKGNRFFRVEDDDPPKRGPGRPPKVRDDGDADAG